jgi:hypothetical protein
MTTYKHRQFNIRINEWQHLYVPIHWPWYWTVYVYKFPFIDPDIELSMFICSHSLILILNCLCLYVAIHWSWYCTVYVYMLPFIDPDIELSMFICCHSLILVLYCLCQFNIRINEWEHINIDSTISGSMNGNI